MRKRVFVGWCDNGVAGMVWKRYEWEKYRRYLEIENDIVDDDCREYGLKLKKVRITIEQLPEKGSGRGIAKGG